MDFLRQKPLPKHTFIVWRGVSFLLSLSAPLALVCASGCASPGPPRPPSLDLPQPVSDLTVNRTGDLVELRFTLPHVSTEVLVRIETKS